MKPVLIEKECVSKLHFTREAIATNLNKEELKHLKVKLRKATSLGNLHHEKVRIIFNSQEGVKEVHTTIWATAEKYVLLKKGVFIPIEQIIDVVV